MGDDDADVKSGIERKANGTTILWVDGKRIRLRTPRAGEFRNLRNDARDRLDRCRDEQRAATKLAATITEDVIRRREGDPTAEMTDEQRQQDQDAARHLDDVIENSMLEWWFEVIGVLRDGGDQINFDTPMDLPPWMALTSECREQQDHWMTLPSLSGDAPTPMVSPEPQPTS